MKKRIVVAGCRDFNNYEVAKNHIDFCIQNIRKKFELVFVSGGCKGADALGERYARENGFEIEIYEAEWGKYGNAAGPIRNKKMAEVSDYVICFWDGKSRGTRSMIKEAKEKGKTVSVYNINE